MVFFKTLLGVAQVLALFLALGFLLSAANWQSGAVFAFAVAVLAALAFVLSLPALAAGMNAAQILACFAVLAPLWLLWHGWHERHMWKLAAGIVLATPFVWLFGHCWGRPALHFLMPWLKKDP